MSGMQSSLTGAQGERVALSDVAVMATLTDLLCEVSIAQTYRNIEQQNIEAVYTFPLPIDAVLLDVEVQLGERVLRGHVVEKHAAEERYEDALSSGDSAVMLELLEPGRYTMNVGNLLPGETAKITIRYSQLYRWAGDRLRVFVPTTIAPRYGVPQHLPHQQPESSLHVENDFALELHVRGTLREAQFTCPSHAVRLTSGDDTTIIALREPRAVMDRDFVLQIKAPRAARSFALCGTDGEGSAVLASFQPFFTGLRQPRPLSLGLVIDCSGSMQGESMAQARRALSDILGLLEPHDRVNIVAFGSSVRSLFEQMSPCSGHALAEARRFVAELDANMGGTEVGQALERVARIMGQEGGGDVFLVTDGQVESWPEVIVQSQSTGHRFFTVGVGSAVAEAFVRELAARTGGACELVSPNEAMSERIVRHFERMRAPRATRVEVRWPAGAMDVTPTTFESVFEGDTLILGARFANRESRGDVVLELETESGDIVRQCLTIPAATADAAPDDISTIARIGAAARIPVLDEAEARQTALRYRLMSRWTNVLVIAVRAEDEKARDLPALRKVPQTLAAGWGGTGIQKPSVSGTRITAMLRLGMQTPMHDVFSPMASLPSIDARTRFSKTGGNRLIALVNKDPSRLTIDGAIALLRESGMYREFDALFVSADAAGVEPALIAASLVVRVLGRRGAKQLTPVLKSALAALRTQLDATVGALRNEERAALEQLLDEVE